VGFHRRITAIFTGVLLAAGLSISVPQSAECADPLIFAAASMTLPVSKIAEAYEAETGKHIRTSFAASSTLAQQIIRGTPADIYISANPKWMDTLAERKMIDAKSRRVLAGNRLVVAVPVQARSPEIKTADGLLLLIGDNRLAIADPDHVPAGLYAKAALKSAGIWERIQHRLAPTANVRSALALIERAEVPAGIIYRTDALDSRKVRIAYTFPASSHPPILYPAAIVADRETPEVRAVFAFLLSRYAKGVLTEHGFLVD